MVSRCVVSNCFRPLRTSSNVAPDRELPDIAAMQNVQSLVESFVKQLVLTVEREVTERARASLEDAFGNGSNGTRLMRTRRRLPRQLCPVPGCKNTAAPVFGMVCAKHKDVPKTQIAKYRDARRAKKLKAA